jgi:dihydropteroate synthase
MMKTPQSWQNYGVDFSRPLIMGILNVTPDSFSDGGKYLSTEHAVAHALQMLEQGADIIDIGGESSRPGADPVDEEEELKRVIPVIEKVKQATNGLISIDTYKANVAQMALQAGANWINDISGVRFDSRMSEVLRQWDCPVVVMHMKGKPKTMQENPVYDDVLQEIGDFFAKQIKFLHDNGITKLILDPGIGFGKRLEDNLHILAHLEYFKKYGYPVLLGISRKSFIGQLTVKAVDQREAGTIAAQVWSIIKGVHVIRTHDVQQTKESLTIVNAIMQNVN